MRAGYPSQCNDRSRPWGALASAVVVASVVGWVVLSWLARPITPQGGPPHSQASEATTACRLLVAGGDSPYYLPQESCAPNRAEKGKQKDGEGVSVLLPEPRRADPAAGWERLLREAFHGRARVRRARVEEISALFRRNVIGAEGDWTSPQTQKEGLLGNAAITCATPNGRNRQWFVLEFPGNMAPEIALQATTASLERMRAARLEGLYQSLNGLAQQVSAAKSALEAECRVLAEVLESNRAARSELISQIDSLVHELGQSLNTDRAVSPKILALQGELQALLEKRQRLLLTRTPEHPEVQAVEAALRELETRLRLSGELSQAASEQVAGPSSERWITLPDRERVGSSPRVLQNTLAPESGKSGVPPLSSRLAAVSDMALNFAQAGESLDHTTQRLLSHIALLLTQWDALSRQWASAQEQIQATGAWQVVLLDPGFLGIQKESAPPVSQRWWHWLLALVVSVLAGEATFSLVQGLAYRKVIQSPEELKRLLNVPVFQVKPDQAGRATGNLANQARWHEAHAATAAPHTMGIVSVETAQSSDD